MKKLGLLLVAAVLLVTMTACVSKAPEKVEPVESPESAGTALDGAADTGVTWSDDIAGVWYIVDADGWTPATEDEDTFPSIIFMPDYVVIYTGLNVLYTSYRCDLSAHTITISTDGPMTMVSGSDHAMHFESALLKALPRVTTFVLSPDYETLYLFDGDEELLLVLMRSLGE